MTRTRRGIERFPGRRSPKMQFQAVELVSKGAYSRNWQAQKRDRELVMILVMILIVISVVIYHSGKFGILPAC